MKTKRWIIAIGILALAAAGWFFVGPLFVDVVVDEPPPVATPSATEIAAMPPAEREALRDRMMAEAAAAPDRTVDESMDMALQPLVVATGRFRGADEIHRGSGQALLYRQPDGSHLLRFEDFAVTNGPALVVLLVGAANVSSADEVQRFYRPLGDLKGNKGNQNYVIPADINVGLYRSVVIWCELFDVLFASATMNAT